MNETQKVKIQRFLEDDLMTNAVYEMLLNSFLKERIGQDVYVLAASKLAIDYLRQGWKEMEKYRKGKDKQVGEEENVGL